jgi:hypothetical protein
VELAFPFRSRPNRLGDNDEMDRKRSSGECPVCEEAPKYDGAGRLTCACGTSWERCWGIKGTPEEEALLEQSGFSATQDVQGDVYYFWRGHIIHPYANGEWNSDKALREQSLVDYLASIRETRAELGECA